MILQCRFYSDFEDNSNDVRSLLLYESGFRSYLSRNLFNSTCMVTPFTFVPCSHTHTYACVRLVRILRSFSFNFCFFFFFFPKKKENLFPSGLMFFSHRLFIVLHCFFGHRKRNSVLSHTYTHPHAPYAKQYTEYTHAHSIVNHLIKWIEDREKEMEFTNPYFVSPSKCKLLKSVSVCTRKKKFIPYMNGLMSYIIYIDFFRLHFFHCALVDHPPNLCRKVFPFFFYKLSVYQNNSNTMKSNSHQIGPNIKSRLYFVKIVEMYDFVNNSRFFQMCLCYCTQ